MYITGTATKERADETTPTGALHLAVLNTTHDTPVKYVSRQKNRATKYNHTDATGSASAYHGRIMHKSIRKANVS